MFGFIDDPHEKLPLSGRNGSGDDLSVWVKQGNAACRTPFILASVDEPVSCKPSFKKMSHLSWIDMCKGGTLANYKKHST